MVTETSVEGGLETPHVNILSIQVYCVKLVVLLNRTINGMMDMTHTQYMAPFEVLKVHNICVALVEH